MVPNTSKRRQKTPSFHLEGTNKTKQDKGLQAGSTWKNGISRTRNAQAVGSNPTTSSRKMKNGKGSVVGSSCHWSDRSRFSTNFLPDCFILP